MAVVVHTDILVSLQAVHGDVQQRVEELDRYRALKAIERTIADFPSLEDVAQSLGDIRDRVREQLDGTREFRALRSIERILPELSALAVLLDGETESQGEPGPGDPTLGSGSHVAADLGAADPDAAGPVTDGLADLEQPAPVSDAAPAGDLGGATPSWFATAAVETETVALAEVCEQPQALPGSLTDPEHASIPDQAAGCAPGDRHPPGAEAAASAPESAHVPSIVDSVAQLMAQAAVPARDPPAPADWSAGTDAPARPPSPAERAA